MQVGMARGFAFSRFREAKLESPGLEADLLLEWVSGMSRTFLHTHPEKELSEDTWKRYRVAVEKRCGRVPLQHITGETVFFGLPLEVASGILVPRPETEIAVETALEQFSSGFFVDWGTGSGCIAAALMKKRPGGHCIAVDCSPKAICTAWRNFKNLGLLSHVLLWHGSDPWKLPVRSNSVDLVISNPPYIPDSQIPFLMPEVRLHDPREALSGGPDGLDAYRMLLPWAFHVLKKGGLVVLEIGNESQKHAILAMTSLRFEKMLRDYSGFARILVLKKE
jgi:release factor glutamine methyltransferase